jgi:aldehyde dehydrogenase (NAD+)
MNLLQELNLQTENKGVSTGANWLSSNGMPITSFSPVDGKEIASVSTADRESYEQVIKTAEEAFKYWRAIPAPQRGEIVRQIGEAMREYKEPLGRLVSYEMGKSLQEGYGEVQEMIDICDFAVGLSRQLYGLTMQSERPSHRMYEQWHPLGIVGIISAFNFPVAVWSWKVFSLGFAVFFVFGSLLKKRHSAQWLASISLQKFSQRTMFPKVFAV